MRERVVIRRHAIRRGHRPERADMVIGPVIAHDTDRLDRQQHGEGLPDRVVEAGLADLVEIDRIGLAQDRQALGRDLAGDADRETRARERMAAERPDLVLEPRRFSDSVAFLDEHLNRERMTILGACRLKFRYRILRFLDSEKRVGSRQPM